MSEECVSNAIGSLLIKLAGQYLLPVLVEEATKYAARRVISSTSPRRADRAGRPVDVLTTTSINTVLSDVPGRLRLRVTPADSDLSPKDLADILKTVPGVTNARINLLTGALLVQYDLNRTSSAQILATVERAHGVRPAYAALQNAAGYSAPRLALVGRSSS